MFNLSPPPPPPHPTLAASNQYLNSSDQNQLLELLENSNSNTNTNNTTTNVCRPLTIIYAKGTDWPGAAPSGNVGRVGGVGPAFFQAVVDRVRGEGRGGDGDEGKGKDGDGDEDEKKKITVQGVDYDASIGDSLLRDGDSEASEKMRKLAQMAVEMCPETKLVLSGFSLGGHILGHAVERMDEEILGKVVGVVAFGSSGEKGTLERVMGEGRVLAICHEKDGFCHGNMFAGLANIEEHRNYGKDAGRAAEFVVERAGL